MLECNLRACTTLGTLVWKYHLAASRYEYMSLPIYSSNLRVALNRGVQIKISETQGD